MLSTKNVKYTTDLRPSQKCFVINQLYGRQCKRFDTNCINLSHLRYISKINTRTYKLFDLRECYLLLASRKTTVLQSSE